MKRVAIEFVGGPFDGQYFDSASNDQFGQAALELYQLFRVMREEAKRQERLEPLGEIITRASAHVMAKADEEGWTPEKRKALMPYYDYAVNEWTEDDSEVLIKTQYVGRSN